MKGRLFLAPLALGLLAEGVVAEQRDLSWKALEGDRVNLNGNVMSVHVISCPATTTEAGLDAKRLVNTFLRGGVVICARSSTRDGHEYVDCAKRGNNGLTLSQMLIFSELCAPAPEEQCLAPPVDALPAFILPPSVGRDT